VQPPVATVDGMAEDSIDRYRIAVPDDAVDDLVRRVWTTRWPRQPPGTGWERGTPVDYLEELAAYWAWVYSWRDHEAALNTFPQYTTVIDGATVHFAHVRSPEPNAVPLLLTHGYPSSFAEFHRVIGPLADPRSHGGDAADAFHVVVPSLPGYGFSTPLTETGWTMSRMAKAWVELMRRLGYDRYFAHGTDVGAGVTGMLGSFDPEHVAAVHVSTDPISLALLEGMLPEVDDSFTEEEKRRHAHWSRYGQQGRGYLQILGTKPQTVAYGLHDSPVALLAWIVEKLATWSTVDIDWDDILTGASIYWFTGSGASTAHFIYESAHSTEWPAPSDVPQGWAVFGAEALMRRAFNHDGKIEHFAEYATGGHFPALEVPRVLVDELRGYFRTVRWA